MKESFFKLLQNEKVRFLIVGGGCFVLTMVINYALKYTVLTAKPTTALIFATGIASIVSYILSSRWTWQGSSGKPTFEQFLGFFIVTVIGIGLNALPQWVSRYIFHLSYPNISFLAQEIADFIAGPILGTALAMVFRFWALDRFVFKGYEARKKAELHEVVPFDSEQKSPSVPMDEGSVPPVQKTS
ncbi:GtrA family protein [Rothia sp. P13129]|uniref:GtrA family protein n=1 Tax=unclassified Rothia (in: high G+C Gram-positive bacteria) TaxID=2689056 RepID=UPI003AD29E86